MKTYSQSLAEIGAERCHAVALPDAPPSRLYLDPEGGFLRQVGWQKTARQQQRLVRCMGAAMAQLAAGAGACTEADLRAHGFTLAEIAAHRDAATLYARTMGGIDV